MTNPEESPARWAHDVPEPAQPPVHADELLADRAWRELLYHHMSFHALEEEQRARLLDGIRQIELSFLEFDGPSVARYYDVAFTGHDDDGADDVRQSSGESPPIRHLVMLQAQLMEQAYSALRLDRYANAPTNRGWMNLFRRWSRSSLFRRWFDAVRPLFSKAFVSFYDHHIRERDDIDVAPVPHPWDRPAQLRQRSTMTERAARVVTTEPPGVYLDSGTVESMPFGERAADEATDAESRSKEGPAAPPADVEPRRHDDEGTGSGGAGA